MKKILLAVLSMVVASGAYATTRTVAQDGSGDFTSIQEAIDAFTEAEVTDGEPDEVVILDGATYDEQVAVGFFGVSVANGSFTGDIDSAVSLSASRDPFTLRGADAENPPTIDPVAGDPVRYGVFPEDAGDSFIASLSYMGIGLTFENLIVARSSVIDGDQYGMNGQAGNTVFDNVLFQNIDGGQSLINFNNNALITGEGIDNSYTFQNCAFDGSIDEGMRGTGTIYFHGIRDSDAAEAGVSVDNIAADITFDGCEFMDGEEFIRIRAREQGHSVTIRNSFFHNVQTGFYANGNGEYVVEDSIFYENANQPGDAADDDSAPIKIGERSGITGDVTVRNSLFVNNLNEDELAGTIALEALAATILINNGDTNGDLVVENCTFVGNPVVMRYIDGAGRERSDTVNNNIFQDTSAFVLGAEGSNGGYFSAPTAEGDGTSTVLTVTGSGNVFDSNANLVDSADLLPNVNIEGEEATVTFTNPSIDPASPFDPAPYVPDVDAGAVFGEDTQVDAFMLY